MQMRINEDFKSPPVSNKVTSLLSKIFSSKCYMIIYCIPLCFVGKLMGKDYLHGKWHGVAWHSMAMAFGLVSIKKDDLIF